MWLNMTSFLTPENQHKNGKPAFIFPLHDLWIRKKRVIGVHTGLRLPYPEIRSFHDGEQWIGDFPSNDTGSFLLWQWIWQDHTLCC